MAEEYASARLLELVRHALAAEGIHAVPPVSDGALLPFAAKRAFLTGVAHDHGLLPLLRVGSALPAASSDPAVSALLSAVGPHDLFERWQRLERFTHSRHRVVVREHGTGHLLAEHIGPPSAPPEPAEDALVLGVLTVLLSLCGARDLVVATGHDGPVTVFTDGAFTAAPRLRDSALWRFTWPHTAPPVRAPAEDAGQDAASRAYRLLAADPARRWTLGCLAAELGLPPRSLQRRLRDAGGFSGLLARVRTEIAAELLMHGGHTVSVIGFACGYADQPHFTRHFKVRTAMTPSVYRAAFRRPAPDGPAARTQEPTNRRTS
ncbi:helix-turn-helix transcriptional regulator [Streptomyces sp. NPDC000594]|uniref:helix-turn-helix transcriptional regulator n=1 Tax=Streptomyces sp. NPDC000594 TaxID=3154261 RepID=UPI0033224AA6